MRRKIAQEFRNRRVDIVERNTRRNFLEFRGSLEGTVIHHAAGAPVRLQNSKAGGSGGGRINAKNAAPDCFPVSAGRFVHRGANSPPEASEIPAKYLAVSSGTSKRKGVGRPGQRTNVSRLMGANGSLNFRFVDIEIGVNVLHVVVFFECFDEAEHLGGLRAGQFDGIPRKLGLYRLSGALPLPVLMLRQE